MKKILILIMLINPLITATVLADGVTGCGLGKKIWAGEKGVVAHTSADTTNGTYSNDTFAISSGTSGCKADSSVKNEITQEELFLASNFNFIIEDVSQGNGEFLESYAVVLGCEKSSIPVFAKVLQSNYPNIFVDDSKTKQVLQNTKLAAQSNVSLRNNCTNIFF